MRCAVPGSIRDLDRDLMALLEMDASYAGGELARATAERRRHLLAVHRKPSKSLAANAEEKVARFRWCKEARPSHAEGLLAGHFRRRIRLGEFHVRLGAADDRLW